MSTFPKGTGVITETTGAAHARSWASAATGPSGSSSTPRSSTRSTPPTSGSASAPGSSAAASRHRTRRSWTCRHATREALAMAGLEAGQIDAVIVATVTHPYQTPGAAPTRGPPGHPGRRLRHLRRLRRLLPRHRPRQRHGARRQRPPRPRRGRREAVDFTDLYDRGTAFIFGDGAGAAIVGPSDTPAIGPTVWGSTGPSGRPSPSATAGSRHARGRSTSPRSPWLDSRFSAGRSGHGPVAQKALDAAGVRTEDLDAFIPHQANMRIIDAMIKQLKLPEDIAVARDIAETANTSAAHSPGNRADAARGRAAARRPGTADRVRGRTRLRQVVVLP